MNKLLIATRSEIIKIITSRQVVTRAARYHSETIEKGSDKRRRISIVEKKLEKTEKKSYIEISTLFFSFDDVKWGIK